MYSHTVEMYPLSLHDVLPIYIAFYGVGAYSYALLDSNQFHVHLPTVATVPIVLVIGAAVGLAIGLPSWRLSGDRSEEHTSELQSLRHLVCRLLLEKKNITSLS